jgi:hypothetical protein
MATATMISPPDEELRAATISLKGDNPSLGVAKLRTLMLQENPTWALSELRLKKILQSEGLINTQPNTPGGSAKDVTVFPSSRLVDDLETDKWSSRVDVKYFDKRKGKGLISKDKIAEGETIWKEDPFVIAAEWQDFRQYLAHLTHLCIGIFTNCNNHRAHACIAQHR